MSEQTTPAAPAVAAPAETKPTSCAGCEALDRKLHELALALAQDGNLHSAGEDRLHAIFGDGFATHFEYARPARQINEAAS